MGHFVAKQRAAAESAAILNAMEMERVGVEVAMIKSIRSLRNSSTRAGARKRLFGVFFVTAATFSPVGFLVGNFHAQQKITAHPIQVHLIEREQPVAVVAAAASPAQPPLNETGRSEAIIDSRKFDVVIKPASATASALVPVPVIKPSPVAKTIGLKPQAPVTQRLEQQKTTNTQTKSLDKELDKVKRIEESEFVLSNRKFAEPAGQKQATELKPSAPTKGEYKVVNIIDGILIVREGVQVKQIRPGEKMPDGQTLKSVNAEKGKFDTTR